MLNARNQVRKVKHCMTLFICTSRFGKSKEAERRLVVIRVLREYLMDVRVSFEVRTMFFK